MVSVTYFFIFQVVQTKTILQQQQQQKKCFKRMFDPESAVLFSPQLIFGVTVF